MPTASGPSTQEPPLPTARDLAQATEEHPRLPSGPGERFAGYGIMGLPFSSGHVLALRRFGGSSIGPGYTSVWHRSPAGDWTMFQDVAPELGCARYFGPAIARTVVGPISVRWPEADRLEVQLEGPPTLAWTCTVSEPPALVAMNALARRMPERWWREDRVLRAMAGAAHWTLGAGRLGLTGRTPGGQHFIANPLVTFAVSDSRARLDQESLGAPGPLARQDRLGDFWIPQRGLLVIGRSTFEPLPTDRHRGRPRETQALDAPPSPS